MTDARAAAIGARLDRLPASPYLWRLLVLLSLGGFFEVYDLFLTAYVTPGLEREHVFAPGEQATFASVMFAGLFVGTLVFGWVADRHGRRAIFTFALLWYAAATLIMALQTTTLGVEAWRFVAGVGVGVELVTIDTYLTELMPKAVRGRAFAISQAIQFIAVPAATLLSWQLVPRDPFGIAGWRFVVLVPVLGAIAVWWIRRAIPESPRWLAQHGKLDAAEAIVAQIEARSGAVLDAPAATIAETGSGRFAELWKPPHARRVVMLAVFNFFQTIGFYGFSNFVPQLISAQGVTITKSLEYAFVIALVYPLGPLACSRIADRFERKWQIVLAALGTATFGLTFAAVPATAPLVIGLGILITTTNNLLSYSYHAYQAELFPTRIRARAVGFVYSFSRLSTVANTFLVAWSLRGFGTPGVFGLIALSMAVVMVSIGVFGPRTNRRSLEEI